MRPGRVAVTVTGSARLLRNNGQCRHTKCCRHTQGATVPNGWRATHNPESRAGWPPPAVVLREAQWTLLLSTTTWKALRPVGASLSRSFQGRSRCGSRSKVCSYQRCSLTEPRDTATNTQPLPQTKTRQEGYVSPSLPSNRHTLQCPRFSSWRCSRCSCAVAAGLHTPLGILAHLTKRKGRGTTRRKEGVLQRGARQPGKKNGKEIRAVFAKAQSPQACNNKQPKQQQLGVAQDNVGVLARVPRACVRNRKQFSHDSASSPTALRKLHESYPLSFTAAQG